MDCDDFTPPAAGLDDVCAGIGGFGDFVFTITSASDQDIVTLAFNPGCTASCECTEPLAGHADITSTGIRAGLFGLQAEALPAALSEGIPAAAT